MKFKTKAIALTDFSKYIKKVDNDTYSKITGKKLMSFSSLTNYFSKFSLEKVPKHMLQNAKVFGSNVMLHLQELYKNKVKDLTKYDFFSESEKACVIDILRKIEDQHCKIVNVEDLVTNNKWYGYIDMILKKRSTHRKYKIVELKTSTSFQVKFRHKLQLAVYAGIMLDNNFVWQYNKPHLDLELWIYNTKECKLQTFKMDFKEIRRITKQLNDVLDLFDLSDYKFGWVEKRKKRNYGR